MGEQRTGAKDRRFRLTSEVKDLVASNRSDKEVLDRVVRLVHDAHPPWSWTGIYLLVDGMLEVGSFTGSEEPPEHSRIRVGDGVCGTAVAEDRNQVVEDVREVENYLACSLDTRSELVVLIRENGHIVGQFDIDSDERAAFTREDESLLENLAVLISPRVASLARKEAE